MYALRDATQSKLKKFVEALRRETGTQLLCSRGCVHVAIDTLALCGSGENWDDGLLYRQLPNYCLILTLLKRKVLVNKGDRHAPFANATRYAFNRIVAYITGAEHTRQIRFE